MELHVQALEADLPAVSACIPVVSPTLIVLNASDGQEMSDVTFWDIIIQKIKQYQPMARGGQAAGPLPMTKFMICCPYTQVELVDKQFWQRAEDPLAVWLLCLWDVG